MHDIYGKDVGATIDFHKFGHIDGSTHEAIHPWPEDTRVSAGGGVVFAKEGNYTTLFMEVYPPGASFIRGEGATPQECEESCWDQYQKALRCPSGTHEWESRKYRNGAGFCKHCGTFKSDAFTGEQLGQLCQTCGVGTTYHWAEVDGKMIFQCKEHAPKPDPERWIEDLLRNLGASHDDA